MRLPIILIGLSVILSCDPKESFRNNLYLRTFKNVSDQEVRLVYHNFGNNGSNTENVIVTDTLVLAVNTKKQDSFEQRYSSDGVIEGNNQLIIETNISIYNTTVDEVPKFELCKGNEFIKEWKGTADYLGDEINSPYNFDSWEIFKYEEVISPSHSQFIYGEIVFTITNDDIK